MEETLEILNQLNNSFRILSENKLVHRDLKLANILVKYEDKEKTKMIYKLIDYGISKQLNDLTRELNTFIGTESMMAPEILKGNKYNEKCDLWSLGLIIYSLLFNKNPNEKELHELDTGNKDLNDLIKGLLTIDPNKRLNWEEYLNHSFFINNSPKKNQIIIKIKITHKDKIGKEFKDIYFLDNDFYVFNGTLKKYEQEHKHINELQENNNILYIDNNKYDFCKFFKPTKEGEYTITMIFSKKLKNCSYMFRGCRNITNIDLSSFDSSDVTDMSYMLSECFNLKEINLNNLNVNNVIDMNHIFDKCQNLEKIEFPQSFNTQNVKNMSFMFHWCYNLSEINFSSSFINNKLVNIRGLFAKCQKLKYLDLTNFNTKEVQDMSYMFDNCINLEEIKMNPFTSSKVTNMGHMFNKCFLLKNINLTSFKGEHVKCMSFMFNDCKQLIDVDLSKLNNDNEINMINMFDGCSNLKKINLSSYKIKSKSNIEKMFDNLLNLEQIIVNKNSIESYKNKFDNIKLKFTPN